jgi:hypothetical protein
MRTTMSTGYTLPAAIGPAKVVSYRPLVFRRPTVDRFMKEHAFRVWRLLLRSACDHSSAAAEDEYHESVTTMVQAIANHG